MSSWSLRWLAGSIPTRPENRRCCDTLRPGHGKCHQEVTPASPRGGKSSRRELRQGGSAGMPMTCSGRIANSRIEARLRRVESDRQCAADRRLTDRSSHGAGRRHHAPRARQLAKAVPELLRPPPDGPGCGAVCARCVDGVLLLPSSWKSHVSPSRHTCDCESATTSTCRPRLASRALLRRYAPRPRGPSRQRTAGTCGYPREFVSLCGLECAGTAVFRNARIDAIKANYDAFFSYRFHGLHTVLEHSVHF